MRIIRTIPLTIVLFFFFVLTFILFSLFPLRLDFSKGSAYTLSSATKKIIQNNKKNIDIALYVSSDLPTRIIPLRTDVVELLQEYRRGGKNIKISTIDPKKDAATVDKVKQLGVPELQFSQLEQNKYQTSSFYFGLVLSADGKNEVIPQVSDFQNLEYNVTAGIYRLTRPDMPRVALVGEIPGYVQQNPLNSLKQMLSQQYTVASVDLSTLKTDEDAKKFIQENTAVILIDNGSTKYTTEQLQLLRQFYESGKSVLVFAGGAKIDEQTLTVAQADHNIGELLAPYGVSLDYNLVLSTSAEYVNFGNATSQYFAPYPFWIRSNSFDTKSGLFTNIQYVSFPWASSLTLKKSDLATTTPLIRSSSRSWIQKDTYALNPNAIPQPTQKDLNTRIVGALVKNKKGAEMMVIPSSRFLYEQYMTKDEGNLEFLLNAVDAFSSNGALSGIRSRIVSLYPIPDMSDTQKDIDKYSAVLLFPLIWGVYGAIRLLRRK